MLSNKQARICAIFTQIRNAILQLKDWNKNVINTDDYYNSPEGMQKLAASCMLIEAIGESINQINKSTEGKLLQERPEIPWRDVIGARNHIAHGYFEVDAETILSIIKNDLDPLQDAIKYFLEAI